MGRGLPGLGPRARRSCSTTASSTMCGTSVTRIAWCFRRAPNLPSYSGRKHTRCRPSKTTPKSDIVPGMSQSNASRLHSGTQVCRWILTTAPSSWTMVRPYHRQHATAWCRGQSAVGMDLCGHVWYTTGRTLLQLVLLWRSPCGPCAQKRTCRMSATGRAHALATGQHPPATLPDG